MASTKPAEKPGNTVALLQPPRLPYMPAMQAQFEIDEYGWRALVESIFPAAKTVGAVQLALAYCKARKLDVFKRPVHIVPIWDAKAKTYIETVWPGIAEVRTTAMRTNGYAGMDAPEFGPDKTETFKGKKKKWNSDEWETVEATVTYPEWCRVTVYRFVHGHRVAFVGPKTNWLELYARQASSSAVPNDMWQKRPSGQLEKCAEAAALRRAFPEELGDEWTAEEASGMQTYEAADVTAQGSATTTEPLRADFDPPPPAEPEEATFERFATVKAFFDFSDHFLQQTTTTLEAARKWEEFYREDIQKLSTNADERIREGIADTLGLYSAILNAQPPADAA